MSILNIQLSVRTGGLAERRDTGGAGNRRGGFIAGTTSCPCTWAWVGARTSRTPPPAIQMSRVSILVHVCGFNFKKALAWVTLTLPFQISIIDNLKLIKTYLRIFLHLQYWIEFYWWSTLREALQVRIFNTTKWSVKLWSSRLLVI